MSPQAQNCITLLRGNQPEKIMQALNMLRSSVVEELMNHYQVKTKEDLANKLFLL